MKLLYSLFIGLIVFYLLSIFWPLIFVLLLIVVVYVGYVIYKTKSYQGADAPKSDRVFTNESNPVDDSTIEEPIQSGTVIDVEFTESTPKND